MNLVKIVFFATWLILFSSNLYSQQDIRKQIIAFTDTTEIMVRNGRKLIVDQVVSGKHEEAIKTLDFLKENVNDKCVILFPSEELLISLASRNFQLFLYLAKNYETLMKEKAISYHYEQIIDPIYTYLNSEIKLLRNENAKSNLNNKDKDLINLFLDYYEKEDVLVLNKKIKEFRKQFSDEEYKFFLNSLEDKTATGNFSFIFSYGNSFMKGKITDSFDSKNQIMDFGMDWRINKMIYTIYFAGSVGRMESLVDLPVKGREILHKTGDQVSSIKYAFKAGRLIYGNKWMNIYPFINLGGFEVNSQAKEIYNSELKNQKNNLSGSLMTGFGSSINVLVKEWASKQEYNPPSILFLRATTGYDFFLTGNESFRGNDFYFLVSVGFGLGNF